VVITTYSALAAEYIQKKGILHNIAWFRVVLDEGERGSQKERQK
jgi:SNF2 family DNA or RNA helicase